VTLIVDASVAVRWFVDGPYRDQARSLRKIEDSLLAPTLLLAEVGNAFWKLLRVGQVAQKDAIAALTLLSSGTPQLIPIEAFLSRAFALAAELDHPVYDCLYLALAEQHDGRVITADRRFAERAAGPHVLWIEQLPL
jgi:predicted nucleic acid-binding protein